MLFDRASDFAAHGPIAGVGELAHGLGDVRRHTRSNRDAAAVHKVLVAHTLFFGYERRQSARLESRRGWQRKPKAHVGR